MFRTILRASLAIAPTLVPLAARAHVTLETPQAAAGATYRAVLRVGHGCEGGGATTALRAALPEGARDAEPTPKPGWRVSTNRRPLPAPAPDGRGGALADVVDEVTWEGGRLPDGRHDEFVVRFRTPDRPGETVWLPVTQSCEGGGSLAWTEVPATGQDPHALRRPAAMLRLVGGATPAAGVRAERGWSRPALAGGTGGGFLVLRNDAAAPDRLLSAASPAARSVELHTSTTEEGVMRMRPLEGIAVPAGGEAELRPGGMHLMLLGLGEALRPGDRVPVTLRFERAGEVRTELLVQAPGAGAPAEGHRH